MKITWTGNRKPLGAEYHPLNHAKFGQPECIYGIGQPKTPVDEIKTMSFVVMLFIDCVAYSDMNGWM